jgi:predicted lipoprotein with Yx(FWY)xxD motif
MEVQVKNPVMFAGAVAALALLSGCGSSNSYSSSTSSSTKAAAAGGSAYSHASSSTKSAAATTPAASGAAITTKHSKLGTVLAAGPKKMTVYLFEADKGGTSACTGACASAWPPVTTSGAPTNGGAANSSALGTIVRADGSTQVTYNGHPLYYFVQDKDAGDAYGEGSTAFGAGWYVLSPSGAKIDKS